MGLLEFNKLPINTLVGADWKTFKDITGGRDIGAAYKGKYRLTKAVCRLLSTLAPLQDRRYEKLLADKPLEHDPVFILGHWRSGTTFVHNVFSCDKHFGYNTTYQTVFPHLMMWGQPFFKKNMSWLMPDKRPTDNMELAVDLPQEEEFALANMMPYTYYNFWFLPKYQQEYADKYMSEMFHHALLAFLFHRWTVTPMRILSRLSRNRIFEAVRCPISLPSASFCLILVYSIPPSPKEMVLHTFGKI